MDKMVGPSCSLIEVLSASLTAWCGVLVVYLFLLLPGEDPLQPLLGVMGGVCVRVRMDESLTPEHNHRSKVMNMTNKVRYGQSRAYRPAKGGERACNSA